MKILITEDEPILADELENIVNELGHQVVGVATTLPGALRLAENTPCDLALVDVHLRDGVTGPTVARRLADGSHTTVIFTTCNPGRVPDDFAAACGVLTKPLSEHSIKSTIQFVANCIETGHATGPKPYEFRLSPAYARLWKVA